MIVRRGPAPDKAGRDPAEVDVEAAAQAVTSAIRRRTAGSPRMMYPRASLFAVQSPAIAKSSGRLPYLISCSSMFNRLVSSA